MGRVLTNTTGLQVAIEDTENDTSKIGQLPQNAVWYGLEPNTFGAIGAEITTVARSPISPNRQRQKGTVTDLNSTAEFEADLTVSHFNNFAEGFVFAKYTGTSKPVASAVTSTAYTVATTPILAAGSLVFAAGFGIAGNNGLKVVGASSTATSIVIAGGLTAEATAPANAELQTGGFRTAAGDLDISVSSGVVTITSAANIFTSPGLSLQPGMAIYIGGATAITNFSTVGNQGYANIVSVASDGSSIVIDKTDSVFSTEANTTQTVDFYTGSFLRNVPTTDANFLERSFQFEVSYPNLGAAGATAYEYSKGNYCNSLAFTMPLTDKVTMSPGFIGTDTTPPTTTRIPSAATVREPIKTTSFNTTQDCARLRINKLDETGLTTDFKSLTVTLSNEVSPEKVLCVLGARFMNYGNFGVAIETQVLFTDAGVVEAIRNNETVSLDMVIKNDNGAIRLSVPAMTMGGGNKDFPVGETVLINLTGSAFADPTLNSSIGITVFPFIPAVYTITV